MVYADIENVVIGKIAVMNTSVWRESGFANPEPENVELSIIQLGPDIQIASNIFRAMKPP